MYYKGKTPESVGLENQAKSEQEGSLEKCSEKSEKEREIHDLGMAQHIAAIWVLFYLVRNSVYKLERKGYHKYE